MEIKGENFIKNVQMKQEREELQAQLDEINKNIEPPTASTFNYNKIQEDNELEDIMLEETTKSSNSSNKTKYIALGLGLIVLFLLTIVAFRLLNNQSTQKSAFVENQEEIKQEEALNEENIEQQYQKIINEKLQTIKEQKTEVEQKKSEQALSLKEIEKEEEKIVVTQNPQEVKKAKELKEDIFDIKNGKTTVTQPKKTVTTVAPVKVEPKKEIEKILAPVKPVAKTNNTFTQPTSTKATTSAPKGSFVQIGAFSKPISAEYLSNIKSKGLEYKLYKVNINGKMYTKVLIGPYRNRAHAQNELPSIKQKLKIDSAFILSF